MPPTSRPIALQWTRPDRTPTGTPLQGYERRATGSPSSRPTWQSSSQRSRIRFLAGDHPLSSSAWRRVSDRDEGFGPRPVPAVQGIPAGLAPRRVAILDEFDMTIAMRCRSTRLTCRCRDCGHPPRGLRVIPLCSTSCSIPPRCRCYKLGQAIARASPTFRSLRVVIYGTGGMSHQSRASAPASSTAVLTPRSRQATSEPKSLKEISPHGYMREARLGGQSKW